MPVVEKRDLRPYVLAVCFLCGLLAGFIAYADTQSAAARYAQELDEQQQAEAARKQQRAAEKKEEPPPLEFTAPKNEATPTISPEAIAPTRIEDDVEFAKSPDWKTLPQDGKVPLNPQFGLNAHTAALPLPPEQMRESDFSPRAPSRRADFDDELPLPDIE
ncbi:hypothetical protein FACS1894139_12030 [Planctomycetales bacterium]|nr:hypothetical protein FACS1894107_08910 [Planctomycetales bacterium]GHT06366.1 hypothetical protein FACS1894139_12030 [Planctomycetales bacterium]